MILSAEAIAANLQEQLEDRIDDAPDHELEEDTGIDYTKPYRPFDRQDLVDIEW